ncbi:MAG: hypothetical protein QM535_14955 [Limnohabitans sp.]|nr:hypothetical protein [Limnohabitans sp.]
MNRILYIGFLAISFNFLTSCNGQTKQEPNENKQTKQVGGGCEGCELMYDEMPKNISSEYTSIGWTEGKQKLILTGKVFQIDGKIPASDVVIYYWHTDDNGLYSSNNETPKQAKEHGKLRGWDNQHLT